MTRVTNHFLVLKRPSYTKLLVLKALLSSQAQIDIPFILKRKMAQVGTAHAITQVRKTKGDCLY